VGLQPGVVFRVFVVALPQVGVDEAAGRQGLVLDKFPVQVGGEEADRLDASEDCITEPGPPGEDLRRFAEVFGEVGRAHFDRCLRVLRERRTR
jgi:hypothetical protein